MRSFTLDTNCIIGLENGDQEARFVRALVDANKAGTADVAVVAMMASERQPEGKTISNFSEFEARLEALDAGHLGHVLPLMYWDISFWDKSLFSSPELEALELEIHNILSPNKPFQLPVAYTVSERLDWLNTKCDVQAIWSHIHAKRDVFVTSDRNFHKASKRPKLIGLGARQILYPKEAVALVG